MSGVSDNDLVFQQVADMVGVRCFSRWQTLLVAVTVTWCLSRWQTWLVSGFSNNDLVFQPSAAQQVADLVSVSDNDLVFQP